MDFWTKYNKLINNFYDGVLKEELIESFVNFYGEKYESKIRNVINNLIILRVQPKIDDIKLHKEVEVNFEKLKEQAMLMFNNLGISYQNSEFLDMADILVNLHNDDILELISNREINENDFKIQLNFLKQYWYKYQYYSQLIAINLKKDLLLTGRNVDTNQYDNFINKIIPDNCDGIAFMNENNCFLIAIFGYGIDLSTLVHEVNHLLSRELLLDLGNDKFESQSGFRNSGDMFYEIINDYMSALVFDNLNSKLGHEFDFIIKRDDYCSGFLEVDEVCHYPVRSIYKMSCDLIKDCLINGDGSKFIKIIGKKNYSIMNLLLIECYNFITKKLEDNTNLKLEEVLLDVEKYDMFDECLSNIYNKLFEYVDYNKNLERQLDDLEKSGTIRRI